MSIGNLEKTPISTTVKISRRQKIFWFCLSMTFASIYGIMFLQEAFASKYKVEDDARLYLFWFQRFLDPELFSNDFITNYLQSVNSHGFANLYHLMATIGLDPLTFSKILPFILGLVATGYCFALCTEILPIPLAGFIASMLLNQNLWMGGGFSCTGRGFVYPLCLAFCYYLLRRSLIPCLIIIILQGLFYPLFVLIMAGLLILQLVRWEAGKFKLTSQRKEYLFCATGLLAISAIVLFYLTKTSQYGATVTSTAAKMMPEFGEDGRWPFFNDNLWEMYISGWQSGIWKGNFFKPWISWTAIALPIIIANPSWFPTVDRIKNKVSILLHLCLVSLGLFFVAHALLFRLYFPNRYTRYTLPIAIAIAAGIAITITLDAIFTWARKDGSIERFWRRFIAIGLTVSIVSGIILYPVYLNARNYGFPRGGLTEAKAIEIYDFLGKQPKNTLIASLSKEADNIPTFARRPVLVAWEFATPLRTNYYAQIRQKAIDLIRAQYSNNLPEIKNFIDKYKVNFFLLDKLAFTPEYIDKNSWLKMWRTIEPEIPEIQQKLKQGDNFILSIAQKKCTAVANDRLTLISADCLKKLDILPKSDNR
jgi:hypothetical protein